MSSDKTFREHQTLKGVINDLELLLLQDPKYAVDDDIMPDGTRIKKQCTVNYHPYAMGRLQSIWGPDAEEFKPERWMKDGVFQPESPFKLTAFQVCLCRL